MDLVKSLFCIPTLLSSTFVVMLIIMGCMGSEHKLCPKPDGMVIAMAGVLVIVIVVLQTESGKLCGKPGDLRRNAVPVVPEGI